MTNVKSVLGYENYAVRDDGAVINTKTGRVLKQETDKDGYRSVVLCENNKPRRFRVSRLVAAAFHRPPAEGEEVNHKDGVRSNNRANNLEWLTGRQNQQHSYQVLGRAYRIPPTPLIAKLPSGFELKFKSQSALARMLEVHPVKVYNALKGRGLLCGLEVRRV